MFSCSFFELLSRSPRIDVELGEGQEGKKMGGEERRGEEKAQQERTKERGQGRKEGNRVNECLLPPPSFSHRCCCSRTSLCGKLNLAGARMEIQLTLEISGRTLGQFLGYFWSSQYALCTYEWPKKSVEYIRIGSSISAFSLDWWRFRLSPFVIPMLPPSFSSLLFHSPSSRMDGWIWHPWPIITVALIPALFPYLGRILRSSNVQHCLQNGHPCSMHYPIAIGLLAICSQFS